MDDSQFDALTRRLGHRSSRRQALRSIAVGVAALITGGGSAAAARSITICHASGDSQTPFTPLSIPQTQFNSHARHGDFLRVDCCVDADCSSSGVCGSAICDNGYCAQRPVAAGTLCGGSYCDGYDYCDGAFSCIPGTPVVCPTDNPCATSVCDDDAEACVEQPLPEGAACGGSFCDGYSYCDGDFSCIPGTPVTCADADDPCAVTICDNALQGCVYALSAGDHCTTDTISPGICDDQETCLSACDECTATNGYDGVCGAPESNPQISVTYSASASTSEFCNATVHISGFTGCTSITGAYGYSDAPVYLGYYTFTTDASGAATVEISYVQKYGNRFYGFLVGDITSDYVAMTC